MLTAAILVGAIVAIGIVAAGVACWIEWVSAEVERHVQAALAAEAADWSEPTRAEVEAGWNDEALGRVLAAIEGQDDWQLFPAPEFHDTPICQQMRHEADVLFAASVLADIDDLPGGVA